MKNTRTEYQQICTTSSLDLICTREAVMGWEVVGIVPGVYQDIGYQPIGVTILFKREVEEQQPGPARASSEMRAAKAEREKQEPTNGETSLDRQRPSRRPGR